MRVLSPPRGAEVTRAPLFVPDRRILERMVPIFLGARLSHDRDNPACLVIAGLNFLYRTDQSRDERSIYRQGCFLAPMLVITAAPRHFCIRCLEYWHA